MLHFRGDGHTLIYMSTHNVDQMSTGQTVMGRYCGGLFIGTVDEKRRTGWEADMMEVRVIVKDGFQIPEGRFVPAGSAILASVGRTTWNHDNGDFLRELM